MDSSVQHLGIELLWDGVDGGYLVRPCAVVNDQAVRVYRTLLIREEAYSLDECTFDLSELRTAFREAHFHGCNVLHERFFGS